MARANCAPSLEWQVWQRIRDQIREKVRLGQYDMTAHAMEEMAEDRLDIVDVEHAILRNYLKTAQLSLIVIPAKAGIQVFRELLDPGFRRGDGVNEF